MAVNLSDLFISLGLNSPRLMNNFLFQVLCLVKNGEMLQFLVIFLKTINLTIIRIMWNSKDLTIFTYSFHFTLLCKTFALGDTERKIGYRAIKWVKQALIFSVSTM